MTSALALSLTWSAIQVSLFAAVVLILLAIGRRIGFRLSPAVALCAVAAVPLLTVVTFTLALLPRSQTPAAPAATNTNHSDSSSTSPVDPALADRLRELAARASSVRPSGAAAPAPDPSVSASPGWLAGTGTAFGRVSEVFVASAVAVSGWVAVAMLIGMALGLVRLAVGLNSIRSLRRASIPIKSGPLVKDLRAIASTMSPGIRVRLLECPSLDSPATIGWRRPAILVPSDWKDWSADERRCVLAHELAHIGRRDYVTWIVAQWCALAHFVNPLVHQMLGWFRLELELAADAEAARHSGGNRSYLRVLANLAVRQNPCALGWPARGFLPTHGTLLRRIEMLRSKPATWLPNSSWGRSLAALGVAALGVAVAGLRAPDFPAAAVAQDAKPPAVAAGDGKLTVPPGTVAIWSFRLKGVQTDPVLKGTLDLARSIGAEQLDRDLGIPFDSIERFSVAAVGGGDGRPVHEPVLVFECDKAVDASKLFSSGEPRTEQIGGKTVVSAGDLGQRSAVLLNDNTVAVCQTHAARGVVLSNAGSPVAEHANKLSAAVACFVVDGPSFVRMISGPPAAPDKLLAYAPVWNGAKLFSGRVLVNDGISIEARAEYASAEAASNASKTLEAVLVIGKNMIAALEGGAMPIDPDSRKAMAPIIGIGKAIAGRAKVSASGTSAIVSAQVPAEEAGAFDLGPAVAKSREAARRAQSANNMKQIMLGMHNYADVNRAGFPATAGFGPDGKTRVSWRVLILPYIEQDALFKQYRMDEPWDGPNNIKLLDKIPAIYRSPASADKTATSYFAIAGEKASLSVDSPTAFVAISDGLSNTAVIVESKKSVPWTRPDDIVYEPGKPLPQLGGYFDNGFHAGFGDGSVHFVPATTKEETLRAYFTSNGGEVIAK